MQSVGRRYGKTENYGLQQAVKESEMEGVHLDQRHHHVGLNCPFPPFFMGVGEDHMGKNWQVIYTLDSKPGTV